MCGGAGGYRHDQVFYPLRVIFDGLNDEQWRLMSAPARKHGTEPGASRCPDARAQFGGRGSNQFASEIFPQGGFDLDQRHLAEVPSLWWSDPREGVRSCKRVTSWFPPSSR